MLTTSQAEADATQRYALHANCVLAKPLQFDHFSSSIVNLRDVWLGAATPPPR